MPHVPGHIDDTGTGMLSMNRRKTLFTLAAGAAGTVALAPVLQSCEKSPSVSHDVDVQVNSGPMASAGIPLWGYLSLFIDENNPPYTVAEAKKRVLALRKDSAPGPLQGSRYRIPFFNSNGINLSPGSVVGFHLLRVGCPVRFVIAVNLTEEDHEEDGTANMKRIEQMKTLFDSVGIKPTEPSELC